MLILIIVEWGPYTAYYLYPTFFDTNYLRLNAVSPLFGKLATILTTLVLIKIVDRGSE
jgi:hypothetical protein